ncbi:hypothetical protein, partial [Azovibrio restrictus]
MRQSVQAAGKLPEELSASIRVGAIRLAMMGDQSQSKRGRGNNRNMGFPFSRQWQRRYDSVSFPDVAADDR